MICEKTYLSEDKKVYFSSYLIENSIELKQGVLRPAIVICPGGGYSFTSDREAEPIALAFAAKGYQTFVLRYSVGEPAKFPKPLQELAQTVSYIRMHSKEWFIDTDKIIVTGFSAGAHLAASLGVFWNNKEILPDYGEDFSIIKPNGLILGYPVLDLASSTKRLDIGIQGQPEFDMIDFGQIHPNIKREDIFVRENGKTYIDFEVAMNAYIFGGYYSKNEEEFYSLQNQVSEYTPPTFIWHTSQDDLILPSNSLKFASALNSNHIPYELHIFGKGGHGLALANEITANNEWEINPQCETWFAMALTWLKSLFQ
ncbi:MAG TPA: alpha/beta hydrolase [Lachnospiraceae bacterium]|nr:alpha/beta hydrolase [Lachnospiraceae bacterium]